MIFWFDVTMIIFIFSFLLLCGGVLILLIFGRDHSCCTPPRWTPFHPCPFLCWSQAAIIFLASNIWWVSTGTVRARYCWLPRGVRGAKPGMKKWRQGKGTMLTANFLRFAFSWPGKQRQVVTPDMVAETRWFKSPSWWKCLKIGFINTIGHIIVLCQLVDWQYAVVWLHNSIGHLR